jgi:tetratricopeptide (TPR) repeat protein
LRFAKGLKASDSGRRPVPAAFRLRTQFWRTTLHAACAVAIALGFLTSPAFAVDTDDDPAAAQLDPEYAAGKKAIEAKDWGTAIKLLSSASLRDTRNADIQNYLGYANRNSGKMAQAFKHYERALQLNPRHRGAHEYVGEAYLLVGNLAKAKEHLAALEKICLIPCEEYGELKEKIEAYRAGAPK